jgi:exodeoxyribonuclease V alpha subunit
VPARGKREPVTLIDSTAGVSPGEHLDAEGLRVNDRRHGLQDKSTDLRIVPPRGLEGFAYSPSAVPRDAWPGTVLR